MKSIDKHKVLNRLKDELDTFPLKMRLVAKYIVDHPSDFGLDPIRLTAQKVGVSTNTLVRMAELLGFKGFYEMREPFRQSLLATSEPTGKLDWINKLETGNDLEKRLAEVHRNTLSIVHRTLHQQNTQDLEYMVQGLFNANKIFIMGYRASFGLAHYFYYVARMALPKLSLIPSHFNSVTDDLVTANEGDILLAITFSPYSRETIEVCAFAKDKGMKLFLITDSPVVDPDLEYDGLHIVSTLSTHYFECHSGALSLIETLIAMIVEYGGNDVKNRINAYEKNRKQSNAYWIGKK